MLLRLHGLRNVAPHVAKVATIPMGLCGQDRGVADHGLLGVASTATVSRSFVEDPDAQPGVGDVAARFAEELNKPR